MKDEIPGFVLSDMMKYVTTTAALLGEMDLSPEITVHLPVHHQLPEFTQTHVH